MLDEDFKELDKRLDQLAVNSAIQSETLSRLTDILDEHMKRWAASEARIEHLEKRWEAHLGKVEGAIGTFKLLGWFLGVAFVALQIAEKFI